MNTISRGARLLSLAANVAALTNCAAPGATVEAEPDGARAVFDDCLFAVALRAWRPIDDRNLLSDD
jgi:hypothetical protein